jgi:hypothetical protein
MVKWRIFERVRLAEVDILTLNANQKTVLDMVDTLQSKVVKLEREVYRLQEELRLRKLKNDSRHSHSMFRFFGKKD